MLKFIKGHLTSIDGIEIFPIISLIIFFSFFVGLLIYVARTSNKEINEIKNIPLEEEKK
ncbi:MAG: cbb3-type cytochrome c oxidase subunit 3 [Putridiphycobacter sp.]